MRYWLGMGPAYAERASRPCAPCGLIQAIPAGPYAYLLGLYLGDGCLSEVGRGVYRLRITLDKKYSGIIAECCAAVALVLPNKVGQIDRGSWVEVWSYSKHWACLFPQHGPGPKHKREIVLTDWQREIVLGTYPYLFLRGLIQSDGWRGTNRIAGRYEYPPDTSSQTGRPKSGSCSGRHANGWASSAARTASGRSPCRAGTMWPAWTSSWARNADACPERDSNPHALSDNGF
jgi:hypothetical protein